MVQDSLRDWAAQAASIVEREREQRSATDAPVYLPTAREVSNWRREAVQDLQPAPVSALAVLLQVERPVVTRCVKLNNYWCIKRARWNGEIGFDDEGHVGFATADQGADAAVTLLRRYYLEFGRKSALDVVRRWAPAECRTSPSFSLPALAVQGIGMTLRARWLAAQRGKATPGPATAPQRTKVASAGPVASTAGSARKPPRPAARSRISVVPLRPLPVFRVPDIAAGLGERRVTSVSAVLAPAPKRRQPTPASVAAATKASAAKGGAVAKPARAAAKEAGPTTTQGTAKPAPPLRAPATVAAVRPVTQTPSACTPDEARIRNYAAKMVSGLELGPGDDLKLFEANGTPLPNLPRVMLAMSTVELGILRASMGLIDSAIARATEQARARALLQAAEPPPPP